MRVTIRTIGNSRGVVLPKPFLAQAGLANDDAAEMTIEDGDVLVMGEFGNEADTELVW